MCGTGRSTNLRSPRVAKSMVRSRKVSAVWLTIRTSARRSNVSVCASAKLPVSTYRVRCQIAAQSHKLRHRRNRRSLISYQVPISKHSGDQFLCLSSLTRKLHHAAELGDEVVANLGATGSTRQVGVDLHWELSKFVWKALIYRTAHIIVVRLRLLRKLPEGNQVIGLNDSLLVVLLLFLTSLFLLIRNHK